MFKCTFVSNCYILLSWWRAVLGVGALQAFIILLIFFPFLRQGWTRRTLRNTCVAIARWKQSASVYHSSIFLECAFDWTHSVFCALSTVSNLYKSTLTVIMHYVFSPHAPVMILVRYASAPLNNLGIPCLSPDAEKLVSCAPQDNLLDIRISS